MIKRRTWIVTAIVLIPFIIIIGLNIDNSLNISKVNGAKIIELQQQQLIHGTGKSVSTEIRYLVITDRETFVCESSLVNVKYNNSDLFFHLKKDSIYNFKVSGRGKSLLFDYRNILEVN